MTTSPLTPVWFITGASSGFGKAMAQDALSRGHHVIATARKASSMADLEAAGATVLSLDVTAPEADIRAVVDRAASVHGGRLTHVVVAAGYLLEGAVEEADLAEATRQFATNVLGTVAVSRLVIPYLRAHPKPSSSDDTAVIPSLSTFGSLGGWTSSPACAHYCATKAAVSTLTEGMRSELETFGINVAVIEPGYFRTEFLNTGGGRRILSAERLDHVYKGTAVEKYRAALNVHDNKQPGDVVKGARVAVDILTGTGVGKGRQVPPRIVLGRDCVDAIRAKVKATEEILDDWEGIFASTDHDDMKAA